MVRILNGSRTILSKRKAIDISIRDISLQRLYGVLFIYFELYSDYEFTIRRHPKFYELTFKGWGDPKRGGI